jgi:hypothetical protein
VALSDQEHVEYAAEKNHPEHTQSKKRANFQQAQERLASPRQSMRDLERQKQPHEKGDEQNTQEKDENEYIVYIRLHVYLPVDHICAPLSSGA